ncbi:hypothetical protein SSX86_026195 [Deinandra increscens subsp. villosa]|uniref:Uncharacterized protein n=1 Tax=Deinandra increscens subsp. villosa TaxID=3103831 RepID=A0AAP0CE12_9ASTR
MSIDIGSSPASTSFSTPQFSTIGVRTGGGNANFYDEMPLLEELGINTKQIWNKTASISNPFRVKADLHEDVDLSGPFLFLMAFRLFLITRWKKLHFRIILGWVTVASLFLYVVLNMLVRLCKWADVTMKVSKGGGGVDSAVTDPVERCG